MYTTQGKLVEKFTLDIVDTVFPIRQQPTIIINPPVKEEISIVDIFNPILTNIEATSLDITAHQEQLHDAIGIVNNVIEKHPINCQVSPWSPCNKPCADTGGPGMKYRTITQQAVNGGERCPILNVPCNTQACPTPTDCILSEWSECNQPCTKPNKTPGLQTRKILKQPTLNGTPCPQKHENFVRTCNTQACPSPMDCVVSPWSECSLVTNMRTRKIITPPKNDGKSCPPLSEYCYPVNCVLSDWSTCSKPCTNTLDKSDPGIQTRTILQHPNELGKVCPYPSQLTRQCNTQACPIPFNCALSEWSPCSKPCAGGTQSRTITRQAANGGTACPSPKDLTQSCNNQGCPIPLDCKLSDWSTCSKPCGSGTQSRTVAIQAANGGKSCPNPNELTRICNTQACPPIHCQVSEWSGCSRPCGDGTRSRSITQQPANGGSSCPNTVQSCNTQSCERQRPQPAGNCTNIYTHGYLSDNGHAQGFPGGCWASCERSGKPYFNGQWMNGNEGHYCQCCG
jgi:hypothetical protein